MCIRSPGWEHRGENTELTSPFNVLSSVICAVILVDYLYSITSVVRLGILLLSSSSRYTYRAYEKAIVEYYEQLKTVSPDNLTILPTGGLLSWLHTPLHHYTTTPLHHYTTTPLHHYTTTPLHRYTTTPLHHNTTTPLVHYTTTPLVH